MMLSHQPTTTPHSAVQQPEYALLVGIDWADAVHEVCYCNPQSQQRSHQQVEQAPNALHEWLGK